VVIGDSVAVGPTDAYTQDGEPDPACPRHVLRRVVADVRSLGLEPLVGHELEFVLVSPDGSALPTPAWTPYGLGPALDRAAFLADLFEAAEAAGLPIDQAHAEYGVQQFEISLAPADPIRAADQVLVAKTLIGQVARRHGVAPSFSPVPFAGAVGSGAHQHFSFSREGRSLFAGGSGPQGISPEGGHAIAGVLAALKEIQAVLAGSVLSTGRLLPGFWSGASICWGTENREAAVRFLAGGPANPQGANVEVKVVDPSANPYLASAAILGAAIDGIRRTLPLPAETVDDPSHLDDAGRAAAGIDVMHTDQRAALSAFEHSPLVTRVLGEQVVAALLAVRRHEAEVYGDLDPAQCSERLRLAWTI
jgi:glutamine synthetase